MLNGVVSSVIQFWCAIESDDNNLYCFGGSWDSPDQQLQKEYDILGIEF